MMKEGELSDHIDTIDGDLFRRQVSGEDWYYSLSLDLLFSIL